MWVRVSRLDEGSEHRRARRLWPPEQTLNLTYMYVSVPALSGAIAPMRDSCLWAQIRRK